MAGEKVIKLGLNKPNKEKLMVFRLSFNESISFKSEFFFRVEWKLNFGLISLIQRGYNLLSNLMWKSSWNIWNRVVMSIKALN